MTNAIKNYRTVPKGKEMISDSIFHYISNLSSCASKDLLVHSITNWIALGSYTGFHKAKWCSDHHDIFATINNPNWGDRPTALPMVFSFFSTTSHHIDDVTATSNDNITFMSLCFHKQKKNDNGQTLTYWHRTDPVPQAAPTPTCS
jgi:hypothetical protein